MAIIRDPDEVTMPRKNKGIKYAFYFRTRDQFEMASILAKNLADQAGYSNRRSLFDSSPINVNCPPWNMEAIRNKIPKSVPGDKKYIATLLIAPEVHPRINIDIKQALMDLGLELVSKAPNKPKYTNDDLTFGTIIFRTPEHFKKVSGMLDKQYGPGNWHYRGVKKILPKLKHIERFRDGNFIFGSPKKKEQEMIDKGIKVTVAVVGDKPGLAPFLFKVQLMG